MAKTDVDISVGINDKQVVAALDKLNRRMDAFGKTVYKNSRQATNGINGMTDALFKFERRISTVTRAFQLLGAGAALAVFKNFVDQAQSANNAIRSISETQAQFNALQKETLATANLTGESFRSTATGIVRVYRSIEDMGGTARDAINVVETLNKTLLVSGATGSEATSTLIQFTQALQSGVLQGDELRSLRENAPLAMKAIAKAAGVTTAELKKMGAEGKLTTGILVKAFTDKQFVKELEEMRSRMDLTFSQSVQIASNNISVFFSKLEESTGVLAKIGNGLVLLSNSLNLIAQNKFTILAVGLTIGLAKLSAVVTSLGGIALTTSSAMTVLGIAVSRTSAAVALFVRTNPLLIAISVAVLGIAVAFDRSARSAAAAAEAVDKVRQSVAMENMKFNDFLTTEQLDQLTEAQVKLKINAERVRQLNSEIKTNTQLLGKGRVEADLGRTAAIAKANEELVALEKAQSALEQTVRKWREYADAVKQSSIARTVIADAEAQLAQVEARYATAVARSQGKNGDVAAAERKLQLAEQTLLANAKGVAQTEAGRELLLRQLDPQRDSIELLKKAVALEESLEKTRKSSASSLEGLFASYAADLEKAKLSGEGLIKITDAMNRGVSEEVLDSLKQEIELEVRLTEIRKQYRQLPDKGAALEKQLKLNSANEAAYNIELKLYQLKKQLQGEIVDISFEEFAATKELEALRNGASKREVDALLAKLAIEEKYSLVGEEEVKRLIKIDTERRKAVEALEDYNKAIERNREKLQVIRESVYSLFDAMAQGSEAVINVVKQMIAQLLTAIAYAAILEKLGKGTGSFGSTVGDILTGGTGSPPPGRSATTNIRVMNFGGGTVSARTRSSGDIDIIVNALAGKIASGGSPLDKALNVGYGLSRRGV
jgi:tape measure domain-containing protein